jgi:hypothetical protein
VTVFTHILRRRSHNAPQASVLPKVQPSVRRMLAQEITMSSKPTVFAVYALVVLAVVAVTSTPAIRGDDADVISFSRQPNAAWTLSAPPPSAPTIVAQGRCFNRRFY